MGSNLRLVQPDREPEDSELARLIEVRAMNRRAFREMVKSQVEEHALSRRQRRDFVRFAESVGIDAYEARLLVRAVEYECCLGECAARAGLTSPVEGIGLPADDDGSSWLGPAVFLLTAILIGAMGLRVLSLFSS